MPQDQNPEATERQARLSSDYFESTRESLARAQRFHEEDDHFTAYLYAYIAFNNLYRWLGGFGSSEKEAIKSAIKRLPIGAMKTLYTKDYVDTIKQLNCREINGLNDREIEQLKDREVDGLNGCEKVRGILNIQRYLNGAEVGVTPGLIVRLSEVAESNASPCEKRDTLIHLACDLLYTVRNNQFHAVKSSIVDKAVLEMGFNLLFPIANALLDIADRTRQD